MGVSMVMGMAAGACGAIIGTPAEVALIRMTADGRLPLAERRNYSGVFNALIRMTREEGTSLLEFLPRINHKSIKRLFGRYCNIVERLYSNNGTGNGC